MTVRRGLERGLERRRKRRRERGRAKGLGLTKSRMAACHPQRVNPRYDRFLQTPVAGPDTGTWGAEYRRWRRSPARSL